MEEVPKVIIKSKQIRRKRKIKKKKPVFNPILEDELKDKMKYLKKRIYYCKDTDKKKSYENHIEKLLKRPVINF